MVGTNEAMVRIFQVGFQRDHSLSRQLFNLAFQVLNIATFLGELLVDIREELLRRVVLDIHKVGICLFEFVRVFV
jgi:hypothetical protein